MAYELHIERAESPISLEEWTTVISRIENIRISVNAPEITNPKTGEVIKLGIKPDSIAEIYSPKDKKWIPAFHWSYGKITFRPVTFKERKTNLVWQTAARIAFLVNATIHGDQGEIYDIENGKILSQ